MLAGQTPVPGASMQTSGLANFFASLQHRNPGLNLLPTIEDLLLAFCPTPATWGTEEQGPTVVSLSQGWQRQLKQDTRAV